MNTREFEEERLVHEIAPLLKKFLPVENIYYVPQSEIAGKKSFIVTSSENDFDESLGNSFRAYFAPEFQGDAYQYLQDLIAALSPKAHSYSLSEVDAPKTLHLLSLMGTVPDKKLSTYYQREHGADMIQGVEESLDMVLSRITLPARSNKRGFYETDKLLAIETLLDGAGTYHQIWKSPNCMIYGQSVPQHGEKPILVSSHADIVSIITEVFSQKLDGFYKGTYDNLGTNAAACVLMLNEVFPENVYFAFTADEETGRCQGAKDASGFLSSICGNNPTCIALDVTYDGYRDKLYSIENCKNMESVVKEIAEKTSGEHVTHNFEKIGGYDEGTFYSNKKMQACSICLPCYGPMHTNAGVTVHKETFYGYILSLAAFLHTLTADKTPIQDYMTAKDMLFEQLVESKQRVPVMQSQKINSEDDYEDDYEDDSFDEETNEILSEIIEAAEGYEPTQGGFDEFYEYVDSWYLPNYRAKNGCAPTVTDQQIYACFCVAHGLDIIEDEYEH